MCSSFSCQKPSILLIRTMDTIIKVSVGSWRKKDSQADNKGNRAPELGKQDIKSI